MASQIDENKLTLECKGGGRIRVDPGTRKISVYGYSQVCFFLIIKNIFFIYSIFFLGLWSS
jgi:hypothetical protein